MMAHIFDLDVAQLQAIRQKNSNIFFEDCFKKVALKAHSDIEPFRMGLVGKRLNRSQLCKRKFSLKKD